MAFILVADDEESLRMVLCRGLGARGHEVTAVETGTDALEALAQRSYDLLLSDVVMPELDGIGLALKASRDYPSMPIILMTGFMSAKARADNLHELVARVVSKPFSLENMCKHIDDVLASRSQGAGVPLRSV